MTEHAIPPLTANTLLWAYQQGAFPMADPSTGRVDWYSPDPRGILPLDGFHVPKNLRKTLRRRQVSIRVDTAFRTVMEACAQPRARERESWISDRLIDAYVGLHEMGHAHSVEAWRDGELVGGLYGVRLGGAFFGESMFSRPDRGGTDASKICLVYLVQRLRSNGFTLLDTQFSNEHLIQFGCIEIPSRVYAVWLEYALTRRCTWRSPPPDWMDTGLER